MRRWRSSCGSRPAAGALRPSFVSVTYGADGSTRTRTHECVLRILRETDLRGRAASDLRGRPARGSPGIAQDYWQHGVRHLVALRGDPAGRIRRDSAPLPAAPRRVRLCLRSGARPKRAGDFEISVAAYPEGHPESGGVEADLDESASARSTRARLAPSRSSSSTPMCSCAIAIAARRPASRVEHRAGILPITRFPQMLRFAERCGASVPRLAAPALRRAG